MHEAHSLRHLTALAQTPSLNRRAGNRVAVTLEGYCSVNGGRDVACSTMDISMTGVSLMTLADPKVGDDIKLSLSQIGLLTGRVVRLLPVGIAIEFDDQLNAKLVKVVNWLRFGSTDDQRMRDEREHARISPLKKLVRIRREDRTEFHARSIDLSRSGIAINNMHGLFLRERVTVGNHHGTVVRCWSGGAAIEFDQALPADGFDITIEFV